MCSPPERCGLTTRLSDQVRLADATPHIIWDWNCTLLDDFVVSVEAAGAACVEVGGSLVTAEDYRNKFTRPVRSFYEALLSRRVSDPEWEKIVTAYHAEYKLRVMAAGLRAGAVAALELASSLGITQSVLSMSEHADVTEAVGRFGLGSFFCLVEGAQPAHRTEVKGLLLARHMDAAGTRRGAPLDPHQVLLVGDTQDDAQAAVTAGIRCALVADGCFDASVSAQPHVLLVDHLADAVKLGVPR